MSDEVPTYWCELCQLSHNKDTDESVYLGIDRGDGMKLEPVPFCRQKWSRMSPEAQAELAEQIRHNRRAEEYQRRGSSALIVIAKTMEAAAEEARDSE